MEGIWWGRWRYWGWWSPGKPSGHHNVRDTATFSLKTKWSNTFSTCKSNILLIWRCLVQVKQIQEAGIEHLLSICEVGIASTRYRTTFLQQSRRLVVGKQPLRSELFRTNHQHRRWSTVRVLSTNCLGTDGWVIPLINGAPFTNALVFYTTYNWNLYN